MMLNNSSAGGKATLIVCLAAFLNLAGPGLRAEPAQEQSNKAADDPHAQHRQMLHKAKTSATRSIDITLSDTELVTQNGVAVKLKSDVVGDKIVVIDFVYTTCTTVCPVLSAILGQVQARLDAKPQVESPDERNREDEHLANGTAGERDRDRAEFFGAIRKRQLGQQE